MPPNQVSFATGVAGAGLRWGTAVGILGAPFIFKGLSPGTDLEQISRTFLMVHTVSGSIVACCFILMYVLYKQDNEQGSAASRSGFLPKLESS